MQQKYWDNYYLHPALGTINMVVLYNTTDLTLVDLVRAPGLTKAHTDKRQEERSVSPS